MNGYRDRRLAVSATPAVADAALYRAQVERAELMRRAPRTHLDRAVRAERLAVLCEREARWWGVLCRWTYSSQEQVPLVFGTAVMAAAGEVRARARFWRDIASDCRRRASGHRLCEVIGCDCGGVCDLVREVAA
jgi:hypothetical protein